MLAFLSVALAGAAPKIINGEAGEVEDWPEAGAILVESADYYTGAAGIYVQCSSSLIAPDVVITAAHCVDPSLWGVEEFDNVGWSREPDLSSWTEGAEGWPEDAVLGVDWVFHDDWDLAALQTGLALNYDIGLLFLDTAQDSPLAWLATAEEAAQIEEGKTVTIAGWGMTDAADTTSYGLKNWGDSTIDALADYEFQVGAATEAVRKCHGDSGGPSFMAVESDSSAATRMIGITSHTWDETDCAETGGVDTRADYYLDWIDATMAAACEDGTRVWCETPGILAPPVPRTNAELLDDIRLVGCTSVPGAGRLGVVVAALALVLRRR